MHVFLDTNIFFNNWHFTNIRFKLLFHYLNNEDESLLLSNLVVKEVNNKRDQQALELIQELKNKIQKLNHLNSTNEILPTTIEELQLYNVRDVIDPYIGDITDIPFNTVKQETVVDRALKSIKPFTDGEKGYRDTLIWLSFLDYLKLHDFEGEVAFITENSSDFFNKKGEVRFLPTLEQDITEYKLKAKIVPYNSLHNFLENVVDKIENSINKSEFLDENESLLVKETESYIESLSSEQLASLLDTSIFSKKISSIKSIQAAIYDGIENPEINSVHELSTGIVYIDSKFEMIGLAFNVLIDINDYRVNADFIEQLYGLYNIELVTDNKIAILGFCGKLIIEAVLEYNIKKNEASNMSIEKVYFIS